MDLYERIAIFAIICRGLCSAVDPDWSCDFEEDNCGIIEGEGSWTVDGGALRADTATSSPGDMFTFSIPHTFTSPQGNVSFQYFFVGAGSSMSVKVCKEASEPAFTVNGQGTSAPDTEFVSYSCASTTNVKITFIVRTSNPAPLIKVEDIIIYEISYIATTTPQSARSMRWIIPVTSALVVFFVVMLVVVIVLFCYRRRNQATKPEEKVVPRNRALASLAGHSEVRYSYPKLHADLENYAEIRDGTEPLKVVTIGGDGKTKENVGQHNNQNRTIKNSNSAVCSNLLKNPVYEGSNLIPTRGQGDPINSPISSLLYEEALDNQPLSAPPDDLIDNPLYGGKMDKPDRQMHTGLPGASPTGDLIDNPLYGGQNERPTGQGFSTRPEAVTPDGLVDNPLYGAQNGKLGDDGFNTQHGSAATDELIDNPLYGGQSGKPDGQASSELPGSPTNDDLIDKPLYGDGYDRPVGQGLNNQTEFVPTEELIDNPLYGGQNERPGHGFSTQEEPAPPDDLVDNPLYGGQSEKFHGY